MIQAREIKFNELSFLQSFFLRNETPCHRRACYFSYWFSRLPKVPTILFYK